MLARLSVSEKDVPILPLIAALFFVLTFAIKAFTDGPYVRGEISSVVAYSKYATALVACTAAMLHAINAGERLFVREFNRLMLIAIVFICVSLAMQIKTGLFSTFVYTELFKFVMPIVLAYFMLNALTKEALWKCMIAILIVSIIGYAVDLQLQGTSFLAFFNADFNDFVSETESSGFSEIALMLVLYFSFFRKSKLALAVSFVFSVLTFKRLAMLTALIVIIIGIFAPDLMRRKISKKVITVFKVLTLIAAALWFWILLPGQEGLFIQLFGKDPFDFTMGRSESLRYLWISDFQSYGYGSASEIINSVSGVRFEMDLAKIAFELTPVVAVLFVWLFWDVAGSSFYGLFIIGYYMLNMVTSNSLNSNFAFTLGYLVIGYASASIANSERRQEVDMISETGKLDVS